MNSNRLGSGESKLETGVSYLLIVGVTLSLVLEIIGLILFRNSYGNLSISQDAAMFIRGSNFFTFLLDIFRGKLAQGTAIHFMIAGITVLILTPYLRLIASVFYFGWEKNIKYILITLFVLVVITLSLALH
jgi:uncharacterized membrane protein